MFCSVLFYSVRFCSALFWGFFFVFFLCVCLGSSQFSSVQSGPLLTYSVLPRCFVTCSVPFKSVLLCSIQFCSIPFVWFCFVLFRSVLFYSISLHPVVLCSILFYSITFHSLFYSIPLGSVVSRPILLNSTVFCVPFYSVLSRLVCILCSVLIYSVLFYSLLFYPLLCPILWRPHFIMSRRIVPHSILVLFYSILFSFSSVLPCPILFGAAARFPRRSSAGPVWTLSRLYRNREEENWIKLYRTMCSW